ncbi:MAG: hypothetical protein FJZ04_00925 [Candidatus Moranbacteria bacterium]|nr:hypothetical protein [Candidatus Moranbacteria bacterium]
MLLDQHQREEFAKRIAAAAEVSDSFEGKKFVENFKYLSGIKMTKEGEDKIAEWIKYSSGAQSKMRAAIKQNFSSPRAVYDVLIAEVKPPLN